VLPSANDMAHPLQLLLAIAVVILAAKLAGALARRVGQPAVLGELLAGLVLGPTVLNLPAWPAFADAPAGHGAVLMGSLRDFADVGVVLLMFVAGLETDLGEMRRVGGVAFGAAAGGVILPFAGGVAVASAFGMPVFWTGMFVGTILTATSVSISAQTLIELGVIKSPEGSTILGAAVIDDVMGILVLSVVVAFAQAGSQAQSTHLAIVVARMALFLGAALVGGRAFDSVSAWAEALPVSQGLLTLAVAVAFVYAWAAEYLGGIAAITGSYLAGVLFTRTRLKRRIDEGIHPLTYSVLAPAFFVSIGLRADARDLGPHAAFTVALVVVAVVAKAVGCGATAAGLGFSPLQATRVGLGMISRGEVGLIVAGYGLDHAVIGPDVFAAAVLVVVVTTVITPPLLRLAYPGQAPRRRVQVEDAVAHAPEEWRGS
jgi:Kef-type K+ transport system membrane component KefB